MPDKSINKKNDKQENIDIQAGEDMKDFIQEEQTAEEDMSEQLKAAKEELQECKDRVLRLAAELDNFKKRVEREKAEHIKFALESFAKELLPFLDNLERALESAKESRDIDGLIDGLELTLSGYLKTLERFGLKAFASEGQRFDPNFHEALSVEESADVDENTVLKQLLKGYTLHDRVLRPALVVVSKKCPEDSGQQETNG